MWIVVHCKDCNNRQCLYGTEYWDEEDYYCNNCKSENYEIIDNEDQFTSKDFSIILGSELENGNYHHLTSIPENLLEILKRNKINESKCKIIMEEFSDMIWYEL